MNKYVFDSSIYISFIRTNEYERLFQKSIEGGLLYYSSVVAEELYAGAQPRKLVEFLDKLFYEFEKIGRLLTPSSRDWQHAGKIIAKIGKKYGYERIKLASLVNDALIALSAQHLGAAVVTEDMHDFKLVQEFKTFEVIEAKDL